MLDTIQVKIMMIQDGKAGTISERELRLLEEGYRAQRRECVSEIQRLERRQAAGDHVDRELIGQTERLRSIELELRGIDDFRILFKDRVTNK